jgi:hypothetical protein
LKLPITYKSDYYEKKLEFPPLSSSKLNKNLDLTSKSIKSTFTKRFLKIPLFWSAVPHWDLA